MRRGRVAVVGAGVSGLCTALRVLQRLPGVQVTLIADKFSPQTTSDVAADMWLPHCLNDTPEELVRKWGDATMDFLAGVAQSVDAKHAGVQWVSGYLLHTGDKPPEEPSWKDIVLGFRPVTKEELKLRYPGHKYGWYFTTLLAEPVLFLTWLSKRIMELGGCFLNRTVTDLSELAEDYDVIVNCTGTGAHKLGDIAVTPLRGQLIKVEASWIKHFVVQGDGVAYVVPGVNFVSLGGSHEAGDWNDHPTAQLKKEIWQNCISLVPSLQEAKILYHCAGLRPSRPVVRLEKEVLKTATGTIKVVHNYGHGGAGVTLCWGCAGDAAELVRESLQEAENTAAKL